MPTFEKRTRIAASPERLFAFHEHPDALTRLTPPWERMRVVEKTGGLEVGARAVIEVRIGPIAQRIVAVHTKYEPGRMFQDTQVSGPFAKWEHTHLIEPDGASGSVLIDRVEYELPLGFLGELGGGWFARRKLERLFDFRHDVTKRACEAPESAGA